MKGLMSRNIPFYTEKLYHVSRSIAHVNLCWCCCLVLLYAPNPYWMIPRAALPLMIHIDRFQNARFRYSLGAKYIVGVCFNCGQSKRILFLCGNHTIRTSGWKPPPKQTLARALRPSAISLTPDCPVHMHVWESLSDQQLHLK